MHNGGMFSAIVEKLIRSGMTESEIAAKVGCSQPSVNRIRKGKQKNLSYELGAALLALSNEQFPDGMVDKSRLPAGPQEAAA